MTSDLTPGRELDAVIAEKIFGWKPWQSKHGHWDVNIPGEKRTLTSFGDPRELKFDPETGKQNEPLKWWQTSIGNDIPLYSSEIGDAWRIVEKVGRYGFTLQSADKPDTWRCFFGTRPSPSSDASMYSAATAALAICGAALAAIADNSSLVLSNIGENE